MLTVKVDLVFFDAQSNPDVYSKDIDNTSGFVGMFDHLWLTKAKRDGQRTTAEADSLKH